MLEGTDERSSLGSSRADCPASHRGRGTGRPVARHAAARAGGLGPGPGAGHLVRRLGRRSRAPCRLGAHRCAGAAADHGGAGRVRGGRADVGCSQPARPAPRAVPDGGQCARRILVHRCLRGGCPRAPVRSGAALPHRALPRGCLPGRAEAGEQLVPRAKGLRTRCPGRCLDVGVGSAPGHRRFPGRCLATRARHRGRAGSRGGAAGAAHPVGSPRRGAPRDCSQVWFSRC